MAKILLADDDRELATQLKNWFELDNHLVETAFNGSDALQLLRASSYDVVVLDWQMPGMDGIAVLSQFRRDGGTTPVLMLTGLATIDNKEKGLDAGADDYLVKPFDVRELSARVRSLLRRPRPLLGTERSFAGGLKLIPARRSVEVDGQEVQLKPKEFAILEFLSQHPGEFFSAKQMLEKVWPSDTDASEDSVRSNIKTLRQALAARGREDVIKTAGKSGYYVEP